MIDDYESRRRAELRLDHARHAAEISDSWCATFEMAEVSCAYEALLRLTGHPVQCKLENGNKRTTSWIGSNFAKVGNMVQLLDADGEFWKVTEVFGAKL
ncbi:hypothetical protein TA3x_000399 [Tundrisphaera sp. TA3]|uniref:hypothetical protein n=1 Tax=Tundrisphaera sp. TA3 TaxID=3435775 RepID=UPI003EBB079B